MQKYLCKGFQYVPDGDGPRKSAVDWLNLPENEDLSVIAMTYDGNEGCYVTYINPEWIKEHKKKLFD